MPVCRTAIEMTDIFGNQGVWKGVDTFIYPIHLVPSQLSSELTVERPVNHRTEEIRQDVFLPKPGNSYPLTVNTLNVGEPLIIWKGGRQGAGAEGENKNDTYGQQTKLVAPGHLKS